MSYNGPGTPLAAHTHLTSLSSTKILQGICYYHHCTNTNPEAHQGHIAFEWKSWNLNPRLTHSIRLLKFSLRCVTLTGVSHGSSQLGQQIALFEDFLKFIFASTKEQHRAIYKLDIQRNLSDSIHK